MQGRPSSDVTRRLARWYRRRGRALPWRRTRDPYAIWLSEIMAQQTTIDVVTPRWRRFIARFPTVAKLARARESAVLAEWSGLGYYARARNLHRAAKAVVEAGGFPHTLEGWRALPGVGKYTAAAVASIAYGVPEPVVDGNVVRVLCRLHGLRFDPKAPATLTKVLTLARPLVPPRNPGDHNQAVMDLGALVCTPRAPRCGACPLRTLCRAAASGTPEAFPLAATRRPTTTHRFVAGIVQRDLKILLVEDREMVPGQLIVPMFPVPDGKRPEDSLRKGWMQLSGREVLALERVATLRHSVLERRYRISLFTFKEIPVPRSPARRRQPAALGSEQKTTLLSLPQISRRAHGGLLLKILAAWRAHRARHGR